MFTSSPPACSGIPGSELPQLTIRGHSLRGNDGLRRKVQRFPVTPGAETLTIPLFQSLNVVRKRQQGRRVVVLTAA